MTARPVSEMRRVLGMPSLVLYGLGTVIGAGIYVLVGEVAAQSGASAPLAFLAAGLLAGLTGLSYAELVARHPEAAGSAAFVRYAFGSDLLAGAVGLALGVVGVIASASIAVGGAEYVAAVIDLPAKMIAAAVIAGFALVACLGASASVRIAAAFSLIEIGGLVFVIYIGAPAFVDLPSAWRDIVPASGPGWIDVAAGGFVAFFAFLGFEGMANLAEETQDTEVRTLPRAIIAVIILSSLLYGLVSLVAVLALPISELAGASTPLVKIIEARAAALAGPFTAVAILATLNGVLIEIVVVARLAYGLASHGLLPRWIGHVDRRTGAPVRAALAAGAAIAGVALLVPFGTLVQATSGITLAVFITVNAALWRLKRTDPRTDLSIEVPVWVPVAGVAACAGLAMAMAVSKLG